MLERAVSKCKCKYKCNCTETVPPTPQEFFVSFSDVLCVDSFVSMLSRCNKGIDETLSPDAATGKSTEQKIAKADTRCCLQMKMGPLPFGFNKEQAISEGNWLLRA